MSKRQLNHLAKARAFAAEVRKSEHTSHVNALRFVFSVLVEVTLIVTLISVNMNQIQMTLIIL